MRNAERNYIINNYKSVSNALNTAINTNNISLLYKLIDLGINTGINNNEAIILASSIGNKEAVEVLLNSEFVDPSAQNNKALSSAIVNNHIDIVELLLEDVLKHPLRERVDLDEVTLILAIHAKNLEMVQLLLDYGADPSLPYKLLHARQATYPIIEASKLCLTDMVELLLSDARIDPSVNNNSALFYAATNGCYAVVELLLNDPRVDPLDNNEVALQVSLARKYYDIAKLILRRNRNSKLIPPSNRNFSYSDLIKILLNEVNIRKELTNAIEHNDLNKFNNIMSNRISIYTIESILRARNSLAIGLDLSYILEHPNIYPYLDEIDQDLLKQSLSKVDCRRSKLQKFCNTFDPFEDDY